MRETACAESTFSPAGILAYSDDVFTPVLTLTLSQRPPHFQGRRRRRTEKRAPFLSTSLSLFPHNGRQRRQTPFARTQEEGIFVKLLLLCRSAPFSTNRIFFCCYENKKKVFKRRFQIQTRAVFPRILAFFRLLRYGRDRSSTCMRHSQSGGDKDSIAIQRENFGARSLNGIHGRVFLPAGSMS